MGIFKWLRRKKKDAKIVDYKSAVVNPKFGVYGIFLDADFRPKWMEETPNVDFASFRSWDEKYIKSDIPPDVKLMVEDLEKVRFKGYERKYLEDMYRTTFSRYPPSNWSEEDISYALNMNLIYGKEKDYWVIE